MTTTLERPQASDGAAERTPAAEPGPDMSPRTALARSPRIGTTVAVGGATLLSLMPGLLPRTAGAQGILTALLVAVALATAGTGRLILRRMGGDVNRRFPGLRGPLSVITALLVAGAAIYAGHWQNTLRVAMGTPLIGPDYWARSAAVAAVLIAGCVGIARGIRWAVRRLGLARSVALTVVGAIAGSLVLVPGFVEWRQSIYAAANDTVDPTLVQPVSLTRSGSAESAVSWSSLGAEGRKFVSGPAAGPVRVYVGVESAPDLDSRVALAIRELERSGGFTRSNIVVAVPTGSGWIDANAMRGFAQRFGGDAAVVGLQYSYAPSWVTFVFGRDEAARAARALFEAVERRSAELGGAHRLFVYGQSLGAYGGSAVFTDAADQDRRTCAALWAGPPAGQAHHQGATVLANSSDPVVHWSVSLLWRAPDLSGARTDAPVPRWLPIASFVQTTADLLAALDAPPGHGHRYGTDQGTALGTC
ncbi:alpha/beta-hydrolase family protein [Nocardia sp. NPDC127579]|uniref:alpha/beta-hydrolase family protein n=1 Tax=Nocardia sp. NPDC127579 TaxID=3345402 RepID=UPI00363983FC